MANNNKNKKDDSKIEWFGIDGLLCLAFVVLSIVIGWALIHNVDIIIGRVVPYTVAGVTTIIFIKYLSEVFMFSRNSKNNKK